MLIGSASAVAKTGTSAQHLDPDSGGRTVQTRVALKACDDEPDGYGVVVRLLTEGAGARRHPREGETLAVSAR